MTIISSYRGNHNIKRGGIPIEWSPEMIQEYIKCSKDPLYFIEKYVKIIHVDKGMIPIILFPYQKQFIMNVLDNRYTVAEMSRQAGKALSLTTEIPTPNGWKTMKEIEVGDYIFDENGLPTQVTLVSPIFIKNDCYKITFDDKTSIVCDSDHLWSIKQRKAKKILSTKEMYELGPTKIDSRGKIVSKWKIYNTKPIQYKEKHIDIDPYILGVWLGDGAAEGGRITCINEDLIEYKQVMNSDFSLSYNRNKPPRSHIYEGTIYGLSPQLRYYGLINNKHIPIDYLQNSVENRIKLLQGLMDTDGWIDKNGQNCIAFSYNRYPKLIDDTYELLTSLGLKVFRKQRHKTCSERLYFHCSKEMFNIFKLPRKSEKQSEKSQRLTYTSARFIRSIEKVDSVPTKCIKVDNPSSLFLCSKAFLPTHNTTAIACLVLWFICFNLDKTVAIVSNKAESAREVLSRIQFSYKSLPFWLQPGVDEWNKGSFLLSNNSKVFAGATTPDSLRGYSIALLICDECAHVENWEPFFTAIYPTISSGKESKISLISSVNGINHFWEITEGARRQTNSYKLISVPWQEVPGRDDIWKQETLAGMNWNYEKFAQEFENEYLGSSGTLIGGAALKRLLSEVCNPIVDKRYLRQWKKSEDKHVYIMTVDVSEGKGLDYSAFSVIDITKMPYEQVCSFQDNFISPIEFTEIIFSTANAYNKAGVLIENNINMGGQIADILHWDYEYEHVLHTESAGRSGKRVSFGFGKMAERGIRTTKLTKSVGCAILKLLVEQNKLKINDFRIVNELTTFSRKRNSYQAEPGKHDDLATTLVLFSWLTDQTYFKDLNDINTLAQLREKTDEELQNELIPFGFISDGLEDLEENPLPPNENWIFPLE